MTEDSGAGVPWVATLLGAERLGDALPRLFGVVGPVGSRLGWATVELDRAEGELAGSRAAAGTSTSRDVPADELLGARCRIVAAAAAREVVLLEPLTEGPLAAALARHGEGPVALYLAVDGPGVERARSAGFALSGLGRGPFGRERRVVVGPRDGPFILLHDPSPPPDRTGR